MGICATSYTTKRISMEDATKLLAFGFIGQLKHWWENTLTEQHRINILNHQSQNSIETIQELQTSKIKLVIIYKSTEYLIYTVVMYFIGNTEELTSSHSEII